MDIGHVMHKEYSYVTLKSMQTVISAGTGRGPSRDLIELCK